MISVDTIISKVQCYKTPGWLSSLREDDWLLDRLMAAVAGQWARQRQSIQHYGSMERRTSLLLMVGQCGGSSLGSRSLSALPAALQSEL